MLRREGAFTMKNTDTSVNADEGGTGRPLGNGLTRVNDPEVAFRNWCDVWLDPAFVSWTLEPDAARVSCPVLLVQGAADPYGTLDQLDRIEASVRGPVRRLIVPGGHSPHREAPEIVLGEIAAFVEEADELAHPPASVTLEPGAARKPRELADDEGHARTP